MKSVGLRCFCIVLLCICLFAGDVVFADGSTTVTATIQSTITMTISGSQLSISNMQTDTLTNSNSISINVVTNNQTGYSLYASVGDVIQNFTSLVHESDAQSSFTMLSADVAANSFPDNSWGYSSDAGVTYKYLPLYSAEGREIMSADINADDMMSFLIGAKANTDIASGNYSNVVTFTALPHYVMEITYMQEMTNEICQSMDLERQYQLLDSRDNKRYWVARLADNRCWMTQNLDLEIPSTGIPLTPDDSDVVGNKTLTPEYNGTYSDIKYNEGGELYLVNGGISGTGETASSTELPANSTNWHYHLGDYYNWRAATAGSGTISVIDMDALESICSKGWRLPTSGYESEYSIGKLINAYNLTMSDDTLLIFDPIWMPKAGQFLNGSIGNLGSSGAIWTSRAGESGYYSAHDFGFSVNAEGKSARNYGFSVRCLSDAETYVLNFEANEGSGAPASQTTTGYESQQFTIPTIIPTRTDYSFLGWAESSTATEATYQPGDIITLTPANHLRTLFAVWELPTLSSITYMQEMTSEICANTSTPSATDGVNTPQYQLIDSRDNKIYWVAKLADGNCWMTQNLDLDITADGLSSEDSDIASSSGWSSNSRYVPKATESTPSSSSDYLDTRSWDLGDYVYDGYTNLTCGTSATSYADCTSYGFLSANNLSTDSPTRHYHVGNLYQWNAATAGSGVSISLYHAPNSICPKGWRLPDSISSVAEVATLFAEYSVGSNVQTLLNPPFYFVRGGMLSYGTLKYAGSYGNYWSRVSYSDSYSAYSFSFRNDSNVYTYSWDYRYYGLSVRCVAR